MSEPETEAGRRFIERYAHASPGSAYREAVVEIEREAAALAGPGADRLDYVLTGHRCEPVARMVMDEGRDWWLGRLLEPLADWPRETHCLHIQTPLKAIVLGVVQADLDQLNVLGYVMSGSHLNPHWVEKMAETMRLAALSRSETT